METSSPPDLKALLLGQELFSFLLENTPDQVYFKDTQGRFIRVSRAVAEFMGFTDGLYEVECPSGEEFSLNSVVASLRSHFDLPAEEMFNALLADACDFSRKQEFDDDVCIVAVEQS